MKLIILDTVLDRISEWGSLFGKFFSAAHALNIGTALGILVQLLIYLIPVAAAVAVSLLMKRKGRKALLIILFFAAYGVVEYTVSFSMKGRSAASAAVLIGSILLVLAVSLLACSFIRMLFHRKSRRRIPLEEYYGEEDYEEDPAENERQNRRKKYSEFDNYYRR